MSVSDSDSGDSLTKRRISQPPLNLLFNPTLLDKEDVWKINVVQLLEMLLKLIAVSGKKDFRVCGVAVLTSALIHRLKVESIFRLGKIANQKQIGPEQKNKNIEERLPIPELANISLPFRKELAYPVSLEDLLLILENMIIDLSNPIIRKNSLNLEPVKVIDFQEYLIKFEKIIEEYEIKLLDILYQKNELIFNDFVVNMQPIEIARYFIAMLYLTMKRKTNIVNYDVDDPSKSFIEDTTNTNGTINQKKEEKIELIKISLEINKDNPVDQITS